MASSKKRSAEDDIDLANNKKQATGTRCALQNCDFCSHGVSVLMKYEMRKQGWKQRLVVAFNSLEKSNPSPERWHSLATEIYPFLEAHWSSLWNGMEKDKEEMWRKKVQDCLTHNKDMFESGVATLGKKGFWRMIDREILTKRSPDNSVIGAIDSSTSSPKGENSSTDNKPISSILQEAAAILDDLERRTKEKAAKKVQRESQYSVMAPPPPPPVRTPAPVLPTELLSEYASQRARRLSRIPPQVIENVITVPIVPPATNQQNPPDVPNTEFKNFLSRSGIRRRSCDITHSKPILHNSTAHM